MGNPVEMKVDLEIMVEGAPVPEAERVPGQGWTVSPNAIAEMREIDERIRTAEQLSGSLVVG